MVIVFFKLDNISVSKSLMLGESHVTLTSTEKYLKYIK